jgi:hypothetical protein
MVRNTAFKPRGRQPRVCLPRVNFFRLCAVCLLLLLGAWASLMVSYAAGRTADAPTVRVPRFVSEVLAAKVAPPPASDFADDPKHFSDALLRKDKDSALDPDERVKESPQSQNVDDQQVRPEDIRPAPSDASWSDLSSTCQAKGRQVIESVQRQCFSSPIFDHFATSQPSLASLPTSTDILYLLSMPAHMHHLLQVCWRLEACGLLQITPRWKQLYNAGEAWAPVNCVCVCVYVCVYACSTCQHHQINDWTTRREEKWVMVSL